MERVFDHLENEYVSFLDPPPSGFILNVPRDPRTKSDWFKIHRSTCKHTGAHRAPPPRGTWTDGGTFKVFAERWDDIVAAYVRRADPEHRLPVNEIQCEECNPGP